MKERTCEKSARNLRGVEEFAGNVLCGASETPPEKRSPELATVGHAAASALRAGLVPLRAYDGRSDCLSGLQGRQGHLGKQLGGLKTFCALL